MPSKYRRCAVLALLMGAAGCDRMLPFGSQPGRGERASKDAARDVRLLPPCCATCQNALDRGVQVLWPVLAEAATNICKLNDGTECPAAGDCSATFFTYNGCGTWKQYDVPPILPGHTLKVAGCSDGGVTGNILKYVDYRVDLSAPDGTWTVIQYVRYPEMVDQSGCKEDFVTLPKTPATIRINALQTGGQSGFYICVFVE